LGLAPFLFGGGVGEGLTPEGVSYRWRGEVEERVREKEGPKTQVQNRYLGHPAAEITEREGRALGLAPFLFGGGVGEGLTPEGVSYRVVIRGRGRSVGWGIGIGCQRRLGR